ncbi:MAG: hypothetical protein KAU28_07140, partial [Phycisphaerae bacterium]|nr:hypothetical protein [Phycisphaerae bacterium]
TIVDAGFFKVLVGGDVKPMAYSVEVTKRIAEDYGLVYLTHRPDLLTRKSRTWLEGSGFPAGAMLLSELKDILDSGKFKTTKLTAVRKMFPNVKIGIGDKPSDAQAYVDNGMVAYLIPNYKEKPKDMRKMAKKIRELRGRGRLHVVNGWREVESGIFEGKSYPPKTFASALDRRADRLQAEKEREKKDEDDDD